MISFQCIGCLKIMAETHFQKDAIFDIEELDTAVCDSCIRQFFDKVEPTYWVQSQTDREQLVVQIESDCLQRPEDYMMCNWDFTYGERPMNCTREFYGAFSAEAVYFPKPLVWKQHMLRVLDEERERLKRVSKRVLECEEVGGIEIIDDQKKARI